MRDNFTVRHGRVAICVALMTLIGIKIYSIERPAQRDNYSVRFRSAQVVESNEIYIIIEKNMRNV